MMKIICISFLAQWDKEGKGEKEGGTLSNPPSSRMYFQIHSDSTCHNLNAVCGAVITPLLDLSNVANHNACCLLFGKCNPPLPSANPPLNLFRGATIVL